MLLSSAQSYLPLRKHNKKEKNFNCPDLKNLCGSSKLAWNACGRPLSGEMYLAKKEMNQKMKKCLNKLRASQIQKNTQRRDNMFKRNDHRHFKCPSMSYVCGKLTTESGQTTDPSEILSTFQKKFSALSASHMSQGRSQQTITSLLQRSYNESNVILQEEFSISEIHLAVKHLKCGKAAGPDGITAEHIKYGSPEVCQWLLKVFNRILSLEDIPFSLKEGIIVPIYKGKGKNPLLATSYRGITISSPLSKLLESVILNRLISILDEINVPDLLQTADRKALSCSDATFATQKALLIHLRKGDHSYLCLFDLEKAFDTIEHSILLERLFEIGVNGRC